MLNKPRAIDLYSGVGGWSLGLRLAGIDVVASYEHWGPANETNFKNNTHQAQTVDIRRLSLEDLPSDIDIVVGSPPCTQFSYSNRGGGGDIQDGLQDIKKFLTIVNHLRPSVWAMENVPRVARIIDSELQPGGLLSEFRHLGCETHIIDMADYGLPQRRRRCIAGNFSVERLESYRARTPRHTLGDIVNALASDPVVDPLFGLVVSSTDLTEHVEEDELSQEEVRINRANKSTHVVYNAMPFPDPLDRTVRTITATCTRVSRESVVIQTDPKKPKYRRLTLRERACLQGFPVTFQFYGASYSQKLKMIGNAVPPAFSYLMGLALQHRDESEIEDLGVVAKGLRLPKPKPAYTPPDRVGSRYPDKRTFRFAIPSLQLKSGVRFELCNDTEAKPVGWRIAFYFGTSKAIKSLRLDANLAKFLNSSMSVGLAKSASPAINDALEFVISADLPNMQTVWAHKGPGGTRPFMMLDKFDEVGSVLHQIVSVHADEAKNLIRDALCLEYGNTVDHLPGVAKLYRNSPLILSGLLLGSVLNPIIMNKCRETRKPSQVAAPR